MRHRACPFSHLTACIVMMPVFLLASGAACHAGPESSQERSTYVIGETPSGQPVFVTHYHAPDGLHWRGVWEIYAGERALPERLPSMTCGAPFPKEQKKNFLHRECKSDAAMDPYLSPDGRTLYLNFEECEINTGNNKFITRMFTWSDDRASYLIAGQTEETLLDRNVRVVRKSLEQGNFHGTLQHLRGLTMAGRSGFCVKYPPEELLFPLWQACWYAAIREDALGRSGAALVMLFLQTAVITSSDDEYSDPADGAADDEFLENLALFLKASSKNGKSLEYMQKCLSLLRSEQEYGIVYDTALQTLGTRQADAAQQ